MTLRDQILSSPRTAAALDTTERTLLNWSRKGIGPTRRKAPNGGVYYLKRDVDAFKASLLDLSAA